MFHNRARLTITNKKPKWKFDTNIVNYFNSYASMPVFLIQEIHGQFYLSPLTYRCCSLE